MIFISFMNKFYFTKTNTTYIYIYIYQLPSPTESYGPVLGEGKETAKPFQGW